ncbi:MAG: PD-(D/E)XK nuclease family protein [Acidimicrobiia bacterium]
MSTSPSATTPRHLSPSSASLFEQCPKRWYFRYVERLPEPPSEAALVGTFAHRVLELLLARPPAERTQEAARTIAREVWPETAHNSEFRALGLSADDERAFRWKGWIAVAGLWHLEDPSEVEVIDTERRIRTDIGGVPFLGVIDRVEASRDGTVITDYKSGSPPLERYQDDKLAQVLLYSAAITAADGIVPSKARLAYLGSTVIETEVTEDRVAKVVEALRSTWNQLLVASTNHSFEARPGPLCGWCPHVAHCEEGAAEVKARWQSGRIRSDAPALVILNL